MATVDPDPTTAMAGRKMPNATVLTQETADGILVVSFGGGSLSITEDLINDVSDGMQHAVQAGPNRVLVDLGHVEFFSSSFIEVLFRIWNRIKAREGSRFALCSLQPYCREILEVTNLDTVWELYETREAALAAMSCPAEETPDDA